MLSRDERFGGTSMVMIDIRYMWSAIDSPSVIVNRRHPSRFSRFNRSIRWKKGTGEVEFSNGGFGSFARTGRR